MENDTLEALEKFINAIVDASQHDFENRTHDLAQILYEDLMMSNEVIIKNISHITDRINTRLREGWSR